MPDLLAEPAQHARRRLGADTSRLADLLLEPRHEPPLADIDAARATEIERRVAAFERGEVETFAAGDVLARARRIAA